MVFWVKKIIVFLLIVSTITACLTSCKSKNIVDKESIFSVVDFEKGWDDYCATIESMHIDEVLEVHQAAYDRWNQN